MPRNIHVLFFFLRTHAYLTNRFPFHQVSGNGKNEFGNFKLIEGTFNLENSLMQVFRVYDPVAAPPARTRPADSKSRTSLSGRVRRVSSKFIDIPGEKQAMIKKRPVIPSVKGMRKVITAIRSQDVNRVFWAPVDWQAYGLTDYPEVIKKPMDFGTVLKKIDSREYGSHDEVADDVRLVFTNATTYNRPGEPVHELANVLLTAFNKAFGEYCMKLAEEEAQLAAEVEAAKAKAAAAKASKRRGGKQPKRKPKDSDDDESDDEEVRSRPKKRSKSRKSENSNMKAMRNQVEQLQEQLRLMQQLQLQQQQMMSMSMQSGMPVGINPALMGAPKTKPPQKKRKKSMPKTLTQDQKIQLGQDINKLEEEHIEGVLSIFENAGGASSTGNDDGEVELDIEALDTVSLNKLYKYVQKALAKQRRKA